MSFYQIDTDRLIIRRFKPSDFLALYEYLSDEEVIKYEPYETFTMAEAKREAEYRSNSEDFYAVTLKNHQLIGNLYLSMREYESMELGFVFSRQFHGKGYAYESAKALIDYAFNELNAHRIFAVCNPENYSSWKLMERLGMRKEAEMKQSIYYKRNIDGSPIWQDSFIYAILNSEWKSTLQNQK